MKDQAKTKGQLIKEVAELRQRLAECEASQAERERAEEALRHSEYRYRTALDSARDGMVIVDADRMIVDANPAFLAALGCDSREQVIGTPIGDCLAPRTRQKLDVGMRDAVTKTLREGKGYVTNLEMLACSRDGREIPVEVNISRLRDEGGQHAGYLVVVRDITERKRAEEALKESEELSRGMLEAATIGIYIVQDGKFQYVNLQFEHIGSYTADDFLGKDSLEHVHPEDREMVSKKAIEQLKGQSTLPYEYRFKCKDGGELWILEKVSSIQYKGRPAAIGSFIDITERKRVEEALRESEHNYRVLFDSVIDGIVVIDAETMKMVLVNGTAAKMYGFDSPEEMVEANLLDYIHADDRDWAISTIAKDMFEKDLHQVNEFRTFTKDGKEKWIEAVGVRIEYGGRMAGLCSFSDITERKRVEEKLERLNLVLRTIGDVNQLIAKEKDRDKLIRATCDTFLEYSSYYNAWMALFDESGELVATAEAGLGNDFLPMVDQLKRGQLTRCGRRALRKSDVVVTADPSSTCRDCPLAGNYPDRGAITTRLEYEGRVYGLLSASIPRVFTVEKQELSLFKEVASDIAFALYTIELEAEHKRAEETLRESEERLRALIQNAPDAIYTNDLRGNFTSGNRKAEELVGYSRQELTGENYFEKGILPEEYVPKAIELLERNRRGEPTGPDEFELVRKDGSLVWVEISTFPANRGGEVEVMGIARDITERRRAEEEILRHSKCVEALNTISAAVSQTMDLDEMLNSALEKVLEVTETEAGYIHLYDWERKELALRADRGISEKYAATLERLPVSEEVIRRWQNEPEPSFRARGIISEPADSDAIAAELEDGIAVLATLPLASKSGMHGGLTLVGGTRRWFSPEELELLKATCNEIAVGIENARLLERTRELSVTDELTGLYNRRHFYEVLENEMARTQRYGGYFTLAMLDLDEFKEYNDRFGHTNGDAILRSVGRTLRSQLRNADTVFRYGGDEFTLVLPATDAAKARKIVDRIRVKRLQGLKEQNRALGPALGFSAGIAQFPEDAETADVLVFLADAALYHSKRGGGGKSTLVSELGELAAGALDSATMDQVYALAATVDAKDPHTYGHSKRVATISEMIGKEIALQPKELADLRAAALLHDIGKVGVPDSILTKPGKPTEHEWKILKKHPVEGARIIGYVKELDGLVPLVRHHHEWCNGTGYPDGLKGENIPLGARIISIADAYDTMTTQRPYRDVISQEEALEELRRCSGTQFDPELVEAVSRALNEADILAVSQRSSHF